MTKLYDTRWLAGKLQSGESQDKIFIEICRYLGTGIAHYNWVGFYIVDLEKQELNLGPYYGAPTEHIKIPFGRGICGQAAKTRRTIIVQDVAGESNYLACGIDVKSEIVIPIFKDGRFVAELDIDSHQKNPFSDEDRDFLEKIGRDIAVLF